MSSPAVEHTYRYAFPSAVTVGDRAAGVKLATSGGAGEFPYFFQGQLRHPRLTGLLLRALTRIVMARFHIPPAMLKRILATRDPVVTSGGGWLRFEGFSACSSTYARVDLEPAAYDGVVMNHGTTNVDFNADMRAALAQVRDHERVSLAVGSEDVTLLRGATAVVERKVSLPLRWLKGFVEIQAYQSRMQRRAILGKIELLRFLRSLPRTSMAKTECWIVPAGNGLRLSQQSRDDGLRVAGIERLLVLEELAPFADQLTVFADERGEASEWRLQFGPLSFSLTISAEVWRGFSGEGQVLEELATGRGAEILNLVQGALKWQAELRPEEFTANWDAKIDTLRSAFAALGSRGLVGFDLARGAYFHRELPFDLGLIEEMHPRLKNARKILADGTARILRRDPGTVEVEVPGSGVIHRVRLSEAGDRCTCPWFAKHQGARGPCKHILAAQMLAEPGKN